MSNTDDAGTMESLKQSIERRLAERAGQDPGFITEMMLHPDGVIKPLITEILGDDGEINLADVSTSVHVETGRNLHFVVAVPSGDVEGYGFDLSSALGSFGSPMGGSVEMAARKKTKKNCPGDTVTNLCTRSDLGCPTVYGNTSNGCPTAPAPR
ncbi:MAG: hypothetical protein WCC60_11275 [Ilumatobacteraceae bacterium]